MNNCNKAKSTDNIRKHYWLFDKAVPNFSISSDDHYLYFRCYATSLVAGTILLLIYATILIFEGFPGFFSLFMNESGKLDAALFVKSYVTTLSLIILLFILPAFLITMERQQVALKIDLLWWNEGIESYAKGVNAKIQRLYLFLALLLCIAMPFGFGIWELIASYGLLNMLSIPPILFICLLGYTILYSFFSYIILMSISVVLQMYRRIGPRFN